MGVEMVDMERKLNESDDLMDMMWVMEVGMVVR